MRSQILLSIALFIVGVVEESNTANILGVFYFNGRSHFIMFESLMKGLAARGHNVYVIGHFPQKTPIHNYTDISVEDSLPKMLNQISVDYFRKYGQLTVLDFIFRHTMDVCETVLKHPNVQKFLEENDNFDVVISEVLGPDCAIGLAHRYNVPFIGMTSSVSFPWGSDRVGTPDHPAYISNYFLPFNSHMNLGERIINTVVNQAIKIGYDFFVDSRIDELLKKYHGEDIPPITQLKKNISLLLVNSHYSLNGVRPTVPAFVEVGGIHIQQNGELPKDLKTYMDEAKQGIVYFSFGSLVKGETMPDEMIQVFISVFAKIPQLVIWKIGNINGLPSNVLASEWFPQFEILSHPNVRAYITHGGLMGTQEAVFAGVPMVGIPLFADQELNLQNCASKGVAVNVPYDDISRESVSKALKEVLHNPSYWENAKLLSRQFRDRPQSALETAVYWTEYVIRHRGAPHMRSAALDLPLYQYLLLDVIAVIGLTVIITLFVLYVILLKVVRYIYKSESFKLKLS
ncbi:UDP-glucosyltransferase 2-like [Periplaneta americana]|uniref:UDP-glucosyltransferase 2-like n=1 Tax=Periplaneta americana TaxID=6978 RepID=UPI0037E80C2D